MLYPPLILAILLVSKETADKKRLVETTLQDLLAAFNLIATAYIGVSATSLSACNFKKVSKKSIKEEVATAIKEALPTLPSTASAGRSLADMVAKSSSRPDPRRVKITNGPMATVTNTISVVIGPKAANDASFTSSDETRKAIIKAVKPCDIDLKVNRVVNIKNKAVRIIAESIDVPKLKESPALLAAGLEIKEKERLNPRMVIRDVPTYLSKNDLIADISTHNLGGLSTPGGVKVVYRYPSRTKTGLASVVIETTADIRKKLLEQGRIYLPWQSCRVEDYLRILQCFKCQGFGHLAKNCTSGAICGNCAGAHESSSCTSGAKTVKCTNCVANKLTNSDHKAFDASKCPLIKRRLTEKSKNISY